MIKVKGQTDTDMFIIGHIIDPSAPNVEFKNITFDCKTIKDASGHIFVRQKAGWIPVIKKLPERSVLCCDGHGEFIIGFLAYEDGQFICENENEIMYDPIAWMPLPEPYREEGENHG